MERAQARSTRIKPGERPRRPRDLLLVVNRITAGLTILSIPKERFRIRRSTVTDSVSGFSFISPVHPAPYRSIDPPRPQRIIFPRENAHPAFLLRAETETRPPLLPCFLPDISAREIRDRETRRNRPMIIDFSRENNSFAFVQIFTRREYEEGRSAMINPSSSIFRAATRVRNDFIYARFVSNL